jgi:hypothetical protein
VEIAGVLVVIPVAALAAAQVFDFVSFLAMVGRHGLEAELNPVAVAVAQNFDLRALAILKLAVLGYVALTVGLLARTRPLVARGLIAVGIAAGVLGGISNVASI